MMITRVEVVRCDQGMATVRHLQVTGCGSCPATPMGCCASRTVKGDWSQPLEQWSLPLPKALSLQSGQQLDLEIRSSKLLRLALLVYLSPVVGLLFGALLLEQLGASEGWVVSGAFIVAGGCWLGVRAIITSWIQPVICHTVIDGLPSQI